MTPQLSTLGLAGIAGFTGLVGLEHILRPDYDPIRRYVSEYAVGRYHEVMTVAFFSLAVGSAALLVDMAQALPKESRSTGGLMCLGMWTGAIVVAGLFPTDPLGPDGLPEHPTRQGRIHTMAGVVGFLSLPLAVLLFGRRFRRDRTWRTHASPSITLGALQYGAVALTVASTGSRAGISERLLLALDLAWLTEMSLALRTGVEPK